LKTKKRGFKIKKPGRNRENLLIMRSSGLTFLPEARREVALKKKA